MPKPRDTSEATPQDLPKLVNRRANRESSFRMGRTIAEKREKLETRSERTAARKKDKHRQIRRIAFTVTGFVVLMGILIVVGQSFISQEMSPASPEPSTASKLRTSSIEIIDEAASSSAEDKITSRMRTFIAQLESDLIDLGYEPIRAVIPASAIREVDFYLKDVPGYFKTHIDRETATTAEDIDRLIRYLADQGITSYEYADVRIAGKAFWK